ncbi:hypothetical protein [Nocardioides daejeonensis]|uniref:hypothetical protein n=1 Tax=Nocardioides daejeonensis TaxID=1046556 RepID=UPI000D7408A4|nr:hypothetical protein [Nocardioides daejeonensis]
MVDAQADSIAQCVVGAEPHEVVAAVRGTRPRRLEILRASGTTILARVTTSYGTGVELGLTVELERVEGGTCVTVTPSQAGNAHLAMVATAALAEVVGERTAGPRAVAATV